MERKTHRSRENCGGQESTGSSELPFRVCGNSAPDSHRAGDFYSHHELAFGIRGSPPKRAACWPSLRPVTPVARFRAGLCPAESRSLFDVSALVVGSYTLPSSIP